MDQAKHFYEQAIALDPQFALAHALYSDYLFGRTTIGISPLREVAPLARALAHRALELDPSLPDAHGPLGELAATHDYDWAEAARRFTLATPGGAGSPQFHMAFGWTYFLGSGRRKEAVEQLELAVQGDPLHFTHRAILAMCLGAAGRYAEAEEVLRQILDLDPNFFWTYYFLADLYTARQMFAEALPYAEKSFSLSPWYAPSVGIYAGLLIRTGRDRPRQRIGPEAWAPARLTEHRKAWRYSTSAAVKSILPRTGSRRRSKNETPWSWRFCKARSGNRCAPARAGRNWRR